MSDNPRRTVPQNAQSLGEILVPGMTLAEVQHRAADAFAAAGVEDGFLEAEVLLRHALQVERAALFTQMRRPITEEEAAAFERLLVRRLRREPTAFITGHKEFFSLDFRVTPDALIPRPETEMLVEATLARISGLDTPLAVDVGAGCGAIAVAVAANHPGVKVVATDVSYPALALTRSNARRHLVDTRVFEVQTDLLAGLQARFDVIVANLPYVRSGDWQALAPEIREHEPRLALDGGPDGLELIRRLLVQAVPFVAAGAPLYAEIGDDQGTAVTSFAAAAIPGADISVQKDLAGRDRMLVVKSTAAEDG
jgi:release factor glutamine methyltransferase